MFAVEGFDDVVARLRPHGAELVGEIAQYGDIRRLCFPRGPDGIIIGLAEQVRNQSGPSSGAPTGDRDFSDFGHQSARRLRCPGLP
jgi:hypothetical protein